MKCFRVLIFSLLITRTLGAVDYSVSSVDSKEYTTGDIVTLYVKEIELEKALELKNSRISNLLYVLNVFHKDSKVYFEAIIAEDNNYKEKEDTFKVESLNYRSVKLNLNKNIDIIDNKIVLIQDQFIILLIVLALLLIIIFILKLFLKKHRKKKNILIKREKLNIYTENLSRECFESFYLNRKIIEELYFYDENIYADFLNDLNEIQYKKYWTNDEYELIANKYKKLISTVKDRNGI